MASRSVLKVFPDSRKKDLDELHAEIDEYHGSSEPTEEPTIEASPSIDLEADNEGGFEFDKEAIIALHQEFNVIYFDSEIAEHEEEREEDDVVEERAADLDKKDFGAWSRASFLRS